MGYEERIQQPMIRQFGGLNTRDSEIGLPGNDSPNMINVDLHPAGSMKMRKGVAELVTPAGEDNVEAVMLLEKPEDDENWVYIIADGTLYRTAEPGTWSWGEPQEGSVSPSMPTTQKVWGSAHARYLDGSTERTSALYIFRSDGAPIVAMGLSTLASDLDTLVQLAQGTGTPTVPAVGSGTLGYPSTWGAGHWPRFGRLLSQGRGSRMHVWGIDDDPNKVYYTALDIPWHFGADDIDMALPVLNIEVDGGSYYVNRGDGDVVVSVIDMYAYTVIFKKRRTYIFTGDPGDAGNNYWNPVGEIPVGCVNDRAWVKVGNNIMFWSEDGPRSLSAVQEYGDLQQANLGFKINDQVTAIAPGQFERIRAFHDVENMRVIWYVPEAGSASNNAGYVYYYNTQVWSKWSGDATEIVDVLTVPTNDSYRERTVAGTVDNGMVLVQSSTLDVDKDITAWYITNWINSGEISDASRELWLDIMFGDEGPMVDIYYQTDLNVEWLPISRIIRSIGGQGSAWGTFAWGSAAWGETARSMRRHEIDALFHLIRFKFEATSPYGFEVMGYRPEMRQKGARA